MEGKFHIEDTVNVFRQCSIRKSTVTEKFIPVIVTTIWQVLSYFLVVMKNHFGDFLSNIRGLSRRKITVFDPIASNRSISDKKSLFSRGSDTFFESSLIVTKISLFAFLAIQNQHCHVQRKISHKIDGYATIWFHTYEMYFHINENWFYTDEIWFHINENLFRTKEIKFHVNENWFYTSEKRIRICGKWFHTNENYILTKQINSKTRKYFQEMNMNLMVFFYFFKC